MEKNKEIVVIDKNQRLNGLVVNSFGISDRVNSYNKEKIEMFKKRLSIYLERMRVSVKNAFENLYDSYVELDILITDIQDRFADMIFSRFDSLSDRVGTYEKSKVTDFKETVFLATKESSYNTFTFSPKYEYTLEKLGDFIDEEDDVTELKEFKKELLMGNFQKMDNEEIVERRHGSRGILYVWMAALVSVLFTLGFVVISILKK